ncbi:hypothetical protein G6F22_019118 [Rhizopus arrhizus]|nr:hypothetical protein G6F22_019118 [Rhizopus arrhizus]
MRAGRAGYGRTVVVLAADVLIVGVAALAHILHAVAQRQVLGGRIGGPQVERQVGDVLGLFALVRALGDAAFHGAHAGERGPARREVARQAQFDAAHALGGQGAHHVRGIVAVLPGVGQFGAEDGACQRQVAAGQVSEPVAP